MSSKADPGLNFIIKKLKDQIKSHGGNGFLGLQRKFRIISNDDGNSTISMGEFKKAMRELRVTLNDAELRKLFEYFDEDGSGEINFEEFISGLRDPLNERRHGLVQQAWGKIDRNGDNNVTAEEVSSLYDVSQNPDVISGKITPEQAIRQFMKVFEEKGNHDGTVSRNEFEDYYTNLGANIDSDDYFELMIRNAWHISGGSGQSANSANRRVLVTHKDGRQTVEEIRNDLGMKAGDKAGMAARLRAQGVDDMDGDVGTTYGSESGSTPRVRAAPPARPLYIVAGERPGTTTRGGGPSYGRPRSASSSSSSLRIRR